MTNKIHVFGQSILLKRQEQKDETEFLTPGTLDDRAPVFLVEYCGSDAGVNPGDTVLLKPGNYDAVQINGKKYTYAEGDQILGKLEGNE